MSDQTSYIHMTAEIVSAFVSNNTVRANELPELVATVHASLVGVAASKPAEEAVAELKPAVSIKKSITDDFIVSLEDGRKFKSMKRYLAGLGMTPDDYRSKWGLPRDYPMVAPGYAARRSELAKATGLGNNRRSTAEATNGIDEPSAQPEPVPAPAAMAPASEAAAPAPEAAPEASPKRRGRPKKAAA